MATLWFYILHILLETYFNCKMGYFKLKFNYFLAAAPVLEGSDYKMYYSILIGIISVLIIALIGVCYWKKKNKHYFNGVCKHNSYINKYMCGFRFL